MKQILIVLTLFTSLTAVGQEDYLMHINDTIISIELDKQYSIDAKGTKLQFKVSSKDTLLYQNAFFSFLYPKAFKVSQTKLDKGIDQISILTAEGSGILVQKYETLNPTSLNDILLNELTKESVNYGFKSKRTNYKRKLLSGQEVEVIKDVLRHHQDVNIYEVGSIGFKDSGLIVVTMKMDDESNTEGQKLIELFWKSLKVNFE
jgi:hypothetical protein